MIDEKENSKDIIIKCEHCGEEFTFPSFMTAVALHGIIFLTGKDDGYFGIVCPKCLKTTLRKDDRNQIKSVKKEINQLSYARGFQDEILRYNSVPYNINEYQGRMKSCLSQLIFPLDVSNRMEFFHLSSRVYDEDDDDYIDLSKGYCTYFLGDLAMGPAMTVFWFKKEAIDDLLHTESQAGLKIFPRYVFKDSLCEAIDDFCWKYHLQLDFIEMFCANMPGMEVRYQMISPWQKKIAKSSEFLNILDMFPYRLDRLYPDSFNKLTNAYREAHWESLDDSGQNKQKTIKDAPSHDDMISEVWKCFNRDHVQETLSILSNRFIFEYVELAQKTDFSRGLVWDLKERHLKQLYESIKSPYRRNLLRAKTPKAEMERIQQAKSLLSRLEIVSTDPKIYELTIRILQFSKIKGSMGDVLLLGETGTGKELFAKAVHEASGRSGEFVPVNCSGIPEELFESLLFGHRKGAFTDAKEAGVGYFEQAEGGTLFLDEIGEVKTRCQPILLRAIQEREIQPVGERVKKVDVRIVFATNRDLRHEIEEKNFRRDLYMRINRFELYIPPLKKRKDDIPLLAEHFIREGAKELESPDLESLRITKNAMNVLMNYEWPGNVRELENVIKRIMVIRSEEKDTSDITSSEVETIIGETFPESGKMSKRKKKLPGNTKITDDEIVYWMAKRNNNKSQVSRDLGVDYKTIYRRWQKINP